MAVDDLLHTNQRLDELNLVVSDSLVHEQGVPHLHDCEQVRVLPVLLGLEALDFGWQAFLHFLAGVLGEHSLSFLEVELLDDVPSDFSKLADRWRLHELLFDLLLLIVLVFLELGHDRVTLASELSDVDLALDPNERLGFQLRRHFFLLVGSHLNIFLFADLLVLLIFNLLGQVVALQKVVLVHYLVGFLLLLELV